MTIQTIETIPTPLVAPGDDPYALLDAHFAASPTGIVILDAEGSILTYNDRFLQLWGLSPDRASSEDPHDLLLYMSSQVADCQAFLGATSRFQYNSDEEMYGELIHLANARTLSCNTKPVRDMNGQLLGRVWDYQDVTDVVAARSELRLARYTLDHASSPVLWIEEDGTIVSANRAAAAVLGYSEAELKQTRVWDLNPERTPMNWSELWQEIKDSGELVFESEQMRADGTIFPIEVTAHFFRFEDTELICGFVRDLTEARRTESERKWLDQSIQQAQKYEGLSLLAGGIAHDFNNLLVGVLGNASLALEEVADSGAAGGDLETSLQQIRDAGEHATALTRQLLAYAGRSELQLEHVSLSELVLDTMGILKAATDANCALETRLAPDLPAVEVDPTPLRQTLVNLVTNASEALQGVAGTVTISTRIERIDHAAIGAAQLASNCRPGRHVALEVKDTGIGMDPETIGRIFDPFFSTKLSAHGLGLAAVRGMVHQHRGMLRIESTPGSGTTMTVLLPASKHRPSAASPASPSQETWTATGTVLMVDDDERVLEVGRRMLGILGFDVVACASGAEALEEVERDGARFSLAIVDLSMPGMDGTEVLSELRTLAPELPALLSSGYSELDAVGRSDACDGTAYLPKPYTLEELRLRVQAVRRPDTEAGDDWMD